MSDWAALALAVVLLLGNAFFVGAEFALISARRSQIEPRANEGSRLAQITLTAMENISLVIGVNQLGITVCSLILGAIGEPALAHLIEPLLHAAKVPGALLHPIAFTVSLTVVAFCHVVLGEMIPKNIALAGPDRVALLLGPPIWACVTVLRPLILGINLVARGVLRLMGVELRDEVSSTYTREEIAGFVEESRGEGLLADDEYDRFAGALGFTQKTVSAVLMPPETLTTVSRAATPADVEEVCAATGFSRFPVADGPELVGYLHIKDVLRADDEQRHLPIDTDWIHPFAPLHSGETLNEALEALQRLGAHMGLVADAAGEPIGVAALEDVIEELVGQINDAAHQEEHLREVSD